GPPRRARAQRDPQFLVAVELAEQGVHGFPAELPGLRLDLRPVQVGADQPGPQCAGLRDELAGRAEQAIADAAHHAQPDAPWFGRESFTHTLRVYIVNSDRAQTY